MPRSSIPSFAAAFLLLAGLAVPGSSQETHPSSIVIDDADACGGGSDTFNDVCLTLPTGSACEAVDVFMLLDSTASFNQEIGEAANVFGNVVATLAADFPGVSFAYGTGRYEDYPFSPFGGPSDLPFRLDQAILPGPPAFNTSSNSGGDGPESAIEALYQIATGAGFGGIVPPYEGEGLGGVGWRPESCLRLVLLATDACTAAPFPDEPTNATLVSGVGGVTVPASDFACPGDRRYGQVGTPGVSPSGAATVPETIAALNDLGIQVIGLRDNDVPSTDPQSLLSALATLTGVAGPGVFDITSPGSIEQAVTDAVEAGLEAPIDLALVPNPEIPGLTIHTAPPIAEDVRPGETACFDVTFEGDAIFEGASFSLDFVNAGSGGGAAPLGHIPVTLNCPECFDLLPREPLCEIGPDGLPGPYKWRVLVRNKSGDDIHHLFFTDLPAGVTVEPAHKVFDPPLRPNHVRPFEVIIDGAAPGALDFLITLHDATLEECCAERVEIELPECDCGQLLDLRRPACFLGPKSFSLVYQSLSETAVDYLFLTPVDPMDLEKPLDPSQVKITPNLLTLSPSLSLGDTTATIPFSLSGPQAQPGDQVCFRASGHDSTFEECCSIVQCVEVPDCRIGPFDFDEVGGAETVHTGPILIAAGLGESGGGVLGRFAPAERIEWDLLPYTRWVAIDPFAGIRFASGGFTTTASLAGDRVRVAADEELDLVEDVQILLAGHTVARLAPGALHTTEWPTGFAYETGGGGQQYSRLGRQAGASGTLTWPSAVTFTVGNETFEGDQVIFRLRSGQGAASVEEAELTAEGIPTLAIAGGRVEPVEDPAP